MLNDSTTVREFIMRRVVARCFSELSGRRTRALDGRSTREEDPGATAALHASRQLDHLFGDAAGRSSKRSARPVN